MWSSVRFIRTQNARKAASLARRSQSTAPESKNLSLYMWGTNNKGSIPEIVAPGEVVDVPTLVDWRKSLGVDSTASIEKVVCGVSGTAFVLSDGRCFTCGANEAGQLGHGHKKPVETPTLLPDDIKVQSIVLGKNSSAIIDTQGDLYSFGFGGSTFSGMGQLGQGNGEAYLTPKLVESLVEDGCFAKQVSVGEMHMAVLTTEGEVLTTGAGSYGRLGNLDTVDQLYLEPVELLTHDVTQVVGGNSFTLALNTEGVIHGFGRNDKGQLGTGLGLAVDMYAMAEIPSPIESDELLGRNVIKLAAGRSHAACITEGGELFYWGMSEYMEPERVSTLLHTKVVDVVCGQNYTVALGDDGNTYSFGKGKTGVLGIPNAKALSHPQHVEALADKKVISMSAGYTHVACLVEE